MIIKLGLLASQIDLDKRSLTLDGVDSLDNNSSSRSVDNTLHVDFTPIKKSFGLSYDIVTKDYYETTLIGLYDVQGTGNGNLVYTKGSDSWEVYMSPLSHGAILAKDEEFYYGVNITLEEI